jgi:hypothetical protein
LKYFHHKPLRIVPDKFLMRSKKQKILIFASSVVVLLIIFHIPREWIYDNPSLCIHKSIFGIECPFCGMTRAVYEIVHLKFIEAIRLNFAIFPFLLTTIFCIFSMPFHNPAIKKAAWIMLYITAGCFTIIYCLRIAGLY